MRPPAHTHSARAGQPARSQPHLRKSPAAATRAKANFGACKAANAPHSHSRVGLIEARNLAALGYFISSHRNLPNSSKTPLLVLSLPAVLIQPPPPVPLAAMALVPPLATTGLPRTAAHAAGLPPPTPHANTGRRLSKSIMRADSQDQENSKGWGMVTLRDGRGMHTEVQPAPPHRPAFTCDHVMVLGHPA